MLDGSDYTRAFIATVENESTSVWLRSYLSDSLLSLPFLSKAQVVEVIFLLLPLLACLFPRAA